MNPNVAYVEQSVQTLTILFVPYMVLALNLITDSIFYGTGKTRYMAYQSVITNGTVYLAGFVSYIAGWWTPDFVSIMWLFTAGILVDSALTLFYAQRVLFPGRLAFGGVGIPQLRPSD